MKTLVSMPTEIIPYLRETILQSSGKKEADFAVYRFGSEWGQAVVRVSGESCTRDELTNKAALTAVHTGVTNMDVAIFDDFIKVNPYENTIDDDYFLAGYVAGTISELLGTEHIARIKDDHIEVVPVKDKIEKEVSETGEERKVIDLGKLKRGRSYIVLDDTKSTKTFDIFLASVEKGAPGLCFTRIFPPKIKELGDGDFSIFWLSTVDGSGDINTVKPERYNEEMLKIIKGYLSVKHSIFMIHGIEFLISNNGFEPIFKFLENLKELTETNKGIMLMSVDPKAMDPGEFNILKSEFNIADV